VNQKKLARIGPHIDPACWKTVSDDGLDRCDYHDFEPRIIFDMLRELRILADEEYERGRPATEVAVRPLLEQIEAAVAGTPRGLDLFVSECFKNTDMEYWNEHHAKAKPAPLHRVVLHTVFSAKENLSVRITPGCLSKIGTWTEAPEWLPALYPRYPASGRIGGRPDTDLLYLRNVSSLFSQRRSDGTPYERRVRHVLSKAVCITFWLAVHRLDGVFDVHLDTYVATLSALDGDDTSVEASRMEFVGLEMVNVLSEYRRDMAARLLSFPHETGLSAIDFYAICKSASSWEAASRLLKQRCIGGSADLVPSLVREYLAFLKRSSDYGVWTHPQHLDPEGMPRSIFDVEESAD
jgi:hypothetical protein